jgi:hypothetical protein
MSIVKIVSKENLSNNFKIENTKLKVNIDNESVKENVEGKLYASVKDIVSTLGIEILNVDGEYTIGTDVDLTKFEYNANKLSIQDIFLTDLSLTGDITGTLNFGTQTVNTTLINRLTGGTFGSNIKIPIVTVNNKGLVTSISETNVDFPDELDPTVPTYSKSLNSFNVIKTDTDLLYELLFTKNTAFNKNFGTTLGTVAQGNDSRILNGQIAFDSLHDALTLGTTNGLSLSTQVLSLNLATITTAGAMSFADKVILDDLFVYHNSFPSTANTFSGATVLNALAYTDGHITSLGTRTLLLSDLDYTGDNNANFYELPIAAAGLLGGIKVGAGLAIDGSGVLTATYSYSIDEDLSAIAALENTIGLLRKTANNTWDIDTSTYVETSALTSYYTKTEVNNFYSGATAITGYNKANWDTVFSWGNHASQGYLKSATDTYATSASLTGTTVTFVRNNAATFDLDLVGFDTRYSQNALNYWTETGNDLSYTLGNVGIGTPSPAYNLDVNGSFGATSVAITGLTTNYLPKVGTAGLLGNSLVYDNGTSVGIGTSTGLFTKLDVNGDIKFGFSNANSTIRVADGRIIIYDITSKIAYLGGGDAAILETRIRTAGTDRLTITSAGNVGIGTVSPIRSILNLKDINKTQGSNNYNLYVETSDTQAIDIGGSIGLGGQVGGDSNAFGVISGRKENGTSGNYAGYLALATPDGGATMGEKLRITSTGNVGIGTPSPAYKLDVNGSFRATSVAITGLTTNYLPKAGVAGLLGNSLVYDDGTGISIGSPTSGYGLFVTHKTATGVVPHYVLNSGSSVAGDGGSIDFNGSSVYLGANLPSVRLSMVRESTAASGYFAISTRNTSSVLNEHLRVTSSGNVGIGIVTPDSKLQINSSVDSKYALYAKNTSVTGGQGFYLETLDGNPGFYTMRVVNQAGEQLSIPNTGNVGIGTVSPAAKLEVAGFTSGVYGLKLSGTYNQLAIIDSDNGKQWDVTTVSNADLDFRENSNGTSRLYLKAGGNVGIGITPAYTLDVNGNARFSSSILGKPSLEGNLVPTLYNSHAGFSITADPNYQKFVAYGYSTGTTAIFQIAAKPYAADQSAAWDETGTVRLTVTGEGKVGIGTAIPVTKLDVVGDGRFTGGITVYSPNYNVDGSIVLTNGTDVNSGYIQFRKPGAIRLGYIGYSTTNMNYIAENGANHVFTGGKVIIGNTGTTSDNLEVYTKNSVWFSSKSGVGNTDGIRFLGQANSGKKATIIMYSPDVTYNNLSYGGGTGLGEPISNHYWYTGTLGTLGTGTIKMSLLNNGYVGIGTDIPDSKLRVVGTRAGFRVGYSGISSNYYDADTHVFRNGDGLNTSAYMMVWNQTGLGIGISSPVTKLHIHSYTGSTYLRIDRVDATVQGGIQFATTNAAKWYNFLQSNTNDLTWYSAVTSKIPLVITEAGYVLVNRSSSLPGLYDLQVNGSIQVETVKSSMVKTDAAGCLTPSTDGADYWSPSTLNINGYVPTGRTISINGGTAHALTSNVNLTLALPDSSKWTDSGVNIYRDSIVAIASSVITAGDTNIINSKLQVKGVGIFIKSDDNAQYSYVNYDGIIVKNASIIGGFGIVGTHIGINGLANDVIITPAFATGIGCLSIDYASSKVYIGSQTTITYGTHTLKIDSGTTTGDGLYVNGKIYTTDNMEFGSDRKLKSNIAVLNNPLDSLKKINAYSYNFRNNEYKSFGFIAQEVQKLYPDLVGKQDNHLTLDYNSMTALVAGSLLQLDKKVDSNESRIKVLEQENKELKEQINKLIS